MITSWTVEHFKSAYDRTTLDFAPLTVFAGANSSGKSTMIQSLLLTAQTLQSSVAGRSIVLNGHIVRLGAFDDIVSNGHEKDLVRFGFRIKPNWSTDGPPGSFTRRSINRFWRTDEEVESIQCEFGFSSRGSVDEKDIAQLQPRLEDCQILTYTTKAKEKKTDKIHFKRTEKSIAARIVTLGLLEKDLKEADVSALDYEIPTAKVDATRTNRLTDATPIGLSLIHFLPQRLAVRYDEIEKQCNVITRTLLYPEESQYIRWEFDDVSDIAFTPEFRRILAEIIKPLLSESEFSKKNELTVRDLIETLEAQPSPEIFPRYLNNLDQLSPQVKRLIAQKASENVEQLKKAARAGRAPEYSMTYSHLSDVMEISVQYIQRYFSQQVRYLGPLRDEPKPVYPLAGAVDPRDVGFRGEHTAAVLDIHRNTKVDFIGSKHFRSTASTAKKGNISLLAAVLDWLNYLGVVDDVQTVDKGKLGHELKVMTPETAGLHDLTHVGVGVSQVLPILVLSLLAEPGSTLIFEQPELHLHPRVQTRLADFFVSLNMLGKQCIVETHSEYIINRLRYRSLVSEGREVADKVIIYFVEKQGGHSNYRPIKIDKNGVIDKWPRGFFDEGEETAAAILKAAMDRRERKRKSENE